jgi:hypothetical protein
MATLVDNFNTGTIDPVKWSNLNPTRISNVLNQLQFTTLTSNFYYALTAQKVYDLSNSYFLIEVNNPGNQALGSLEVYPIYLTDASRQNALFFLISGGNISAWQMVSGTRTNLSGFIPYDPVGMVWLRIREAAGVLYYETSPDALGWSVFYSLADPTQVVNLQPVIQVGTYQAEASTTTVIFDNVNSAPSLAATSQGTSVVIGSLVKINSLAGRSHGRTIVTGILMVNRVRSLTGRSTGTAVNVGNFGHLLLVAQSSGHAQVYGLLATQLYGSVQAGSVVAGQLTVSEIFTTAASGGQALVWVRMNLIVAMPGRSKGTSNVRGHLRAYSLKRGRTAGHALTRGSLHVVPAFRGPGRTAGHGQAFGHLHRTYLPSGRALASSRVRASLTVLTGAQLRGRSRGTTTVRGILQVTGEPFVGWGTGSQAR